MARRRDKDGQPSPMALAWATLALSIALTATVITVGGEMTLRSTSVTHETPVFANTRVTVSAEGDARAPSVSTPGVDGADEELSGRERSCAVDVDADGSLSFVTTPSPGDTMRSTAGSVTWPEDCAVKATSMRVTTDKSVVTMTLSTRDEGAEWQVVAKSEEGDDPVLIASGRNEMTNDTPVTFETSVALGGSGSWDMLVSAKSDDDVETVLAGRIDLGGEFAL